MNEEMLNTGFLVANSHTGEWFFCATSEEADAIPYGYRFDDADQVTNQAQLIHALAHLATKTWFNPEQFFSCLRGLDPF
jgi:hypothetical protein